MHGEEHRMRTILPAATSILVFGGALFLQAGPQDDKDTIQVRLRLVDESTGRGVAGSVRVFRQGNAKPLSLAGLADRLRGLERSGNVAGWYVVPADGAETSLPRAALRLEAVSGLETALARQEVDLSRGDLDRVTVKL